VLDSSGIALLIKTFDIIIIHILAFFAVFGIITILIRKSRLNIFRNNMFIQAFCIAALIAFALEATVFNFQHYLKYFADDEFHTIGVSPQDPAVILTSDGTLAELVYIEKDNNTIWDGIVFKNLNRRVTSIFVQPVFNNIDKIEMQIIWSDERSTTGFSKTLYKGLPHEDHTVIQPHGKVSELKIRFASGGFSQIIINKPVPLYFSGLRLIVVSCIIFAMVSFFNKKLRAKTAYYLFEYRFDPANRKQNRVYAFMVILLIAFLWLSVFAFTKIHVDFPWLIQHNNFVVDAIIEGRTYFDYGNPEKLLNAERPYDVNWLSANGYKSGSDWVLDWTYYKGKFNSYFGVVPAVLLYLPYKLITGNYLSNQAGVFLFIAIAVVLMAMLWRFLVKKYMPDCRFVFYLLSFLVMFFAIGLPDIVSFPFIYTIVQAAAFMFAVAGILLLLKSIDNVEKINHPKLFFACLCFALIVGCRPSLIFISLLVPAILWRYRSLKLLLFIMVPYIMIAIPLCWYNYIRFDSIFEFGVNYHVSLENTGAYNLINPIGKAIRLFISSSLYLLLPNSYSLQFPFVEYLRTVPNIKLGSFIIPGVGGGMVNYPIVFCLFYMFKNITNKNRPAAFNLMSLFLMVAIVLILTISLFLGFHGRYIFDFAFFMILPSLFCAYYWYSNQNDVNIRKNRLKIVYALMTASIFIGLFLFVNNENLGWRHFEPTLYRYLENSLGVIRII